MYVACSTLCFARYPLDRALRIIGELDFSKVDVAIREQGPHLRPSEVADDVGLAAQRIRIGPSLTPAAFNVEIDSPDPAEFERQMKALCHLARLSTVSVITLPAASSGSGIDAEVQRLTWLVRLCEAQSVALTVETRIGTLTENPEIAMDLCQRVPGLGLTLDPSHYIAGPNQGKPFDAIYPFVRHVHLRDTGRSPEQFQVRVGQGEVEYGRVISHLSRFHYNRLLSVEINDQPDAPYSMETEVRKLKYLLESLV